MKSENVFQVCRSRREEAQTGRQMPGKRRSLSLLTSAPTVQGIFRTGSEKIAWLLVLIASLSLSRLPALGEESVTIPKARLEELERKEAELEKLKAGQNVTSQKPPAADSAKSTAAPPAEPVATRVSPPLASLPPLEAGQPVEAMDLANYYRADAAAADQRFKKQKLTVRGEVAGFDKPLFRRGYKMILK